MKIKTIILILLLNFIFAQVSDYKIKKVSIEEGLSQASVNSIVEGKLGFIWLSTQDGLNRYDGYNFKHFNVVKGNKNSLKYNMLSKMLVDSDGNIWISYLNGEISRYNPVKDEFLHCNIEEKYKLDKKTGGVFNLIEVNENIWVSTYLQGILIISKENGKIIQTINKTNSPLTTDYTSAVFKYEDIVYIATVNEFVKYNIKTQDYKIIEKSNGNNNYNFIIDIVHNKDHFYVSCIYGHIKKYDYTKNQFTNLFNIREILKVEYEYGYNLTIDNEGYLWFATYNHGLLIWDGKKTTNFSNYNPSHYISDNKIYSIFKNKDGVIWLGSSSDGFYIFNKNPKQFHSINYNPEIKNSLSGKSVYSILEDMNGNYLFGLTGEGIDVFDKKFNKLKQLKEQSTNKGLTSNSILIINKDKNNKIWVATDYGINILNSNYVIEKKLFFHNDSSVIPSNVVGALLIDKGNNIWLGAYNGNLHKISSNYKLIKKYYPQSDENKKIYEFEISYLFQDSEENIWIGTDKDGVFILEKGQENIEEVRDNYNIPISKNFSIFVIYEDEYKNMWIGSTNGLYKYNKQNMQLNYYNINDGLPNNVIYGILEDKNNNLWISTGRGISKLYTKTNIFKNYTTSDGILDLEYNANAFYKDKNGRFLFGGIKGLTYFEPDSIKDDLTFPNLFFTSIFLNNKEMIFNESVPYIKELELNYNEFPITIEFVALNYLSPDKIKYSYKLEGLDKDWNNINDKRSVTYSKIPNGEYLLKVKSTNNEGLWNNEYIELLIKVKPPIYETNLFRMILVISVLFLIYYGHKWNIRKIEKRNLILESIVTERTKELTESNKMKDKYFSILAHDLKNPFLSLFGYTDILNDEFETLDDTEKRMIFKNIRRNLRNLYSLLDNLLNWSSLKLGKINFVNNNFNLYNLANNNIELLIENLKRKKIKIENNLLPHTILYSDQQVVNMLFRNLLSNAVKFSPEGESIKINLVEKEKYFGVEIKDNGVGISKEDIDKILLNQDIISKSGTANEKGTGLGLTLCNELIKKMGGYLEINSEIKKGTSIIFYIPKEKEIKT